MRAIHAPAGPPESVPSLSLHSYILFGFPFRSSVPGDLGYYRGDMMLYNAAFTVTVAIRWTRSHISAAATACAVLQTIPTDYLGVGLAHQRLQYLI